MHRLHAGLTIEVPVKSGKSDDLRKRLLYFNQLLNNNLLPELESSDTILNMAGVIVPSQKYNKEILPETFVLSTSYSGPLSRHLEDLIWNCKKFLVELFIFCEDFPDDGLISDLNIRRYIKSHSRKSAYSSRYNCITKNDAANEQSLRNEIENYLDIASEHINMNVMKAREVKTLIERHIRTRGYEYEWTQNSCKHNLYETIVLNRPVIIKAAVVLTLTSLLIRSILTKKYMFFRILLGVIFFILLLNYYITREKTISAGRPSDCTVRKLAMSQLRPILNEMTASAPLKGRFLRRIFFKIALKIANLLGSSVPTVSHIRWLTINHGKRLFFFISIYKHD